MLIIVTRVAGHHLCSRHTAVEPQSAPLVRAVAPACNQSVPRGLAILSQEYLKVDLWSPQPPWYWELV